jgi:hypothetical protein
MPDTMITHSKPETVFIELVADYLARKFIQPLLLYSNEKNYPAYVGGLAEILDWSIDFYDQYYTKIITCKNKNQVCKNKYNADTLERLIVAFGQERLLTFYAHHKHKPTYFIEKHKSMEWELASVKI